MDPDLDSPIEIHAARNYMYTSRKDRLLFFVRTKRKLIVIFALLFCLLGIAGIVFAFIQQQKTSPKNNTVTNQQQPAVIATSARSKRELLPTPTPQITQSPQASTTSNKTISLTPSTPAGKSAEPSGTTINKKVSSQPATPTSNPQTNNAVAFTPSPTPVTKVQIIFQNPGGGVTVYTPPDSQPVQVIWARYTNFQDRYAIDYPYNWQVITSVYNNHEGLSIYAPGTDVNSGDTQHIGLGWSANYSLPTVQNNQPPYVTDIIVSGLSGKLYTQGALGGSFIASILPYKGGYFGLASSVSTPDFIYVYLHMIESLDFF